MIGTYPASQKAPLLDITDIVRSRHELTQVSISPACAARFWAKVEQRGPNECWPWLGALDRAGYARFGNGKQLGTNIAHRIAWMLVNGPIPDGLDIDHVRSRGCVLRSCVNVNHLEPVTHFENCRRGKQAQQTHCVNGHPFNSENLVMRFRRSGAPYRQCKTCVRIRATQQTAKQKGIDTSMPTPATPSL